MKLSEASKYLPLMQAAAEGKTIQFYSVNSDSEGWRDVESVSWIFEPERYRIKPEPKLRPWEPEEVPVGCLLRRKSNRDEIYLVLAREGKKVVLSAHGDGRWNLETLFNVFDHSLDNGKTWLPCGVLEGGE